MDASHVVRHVLLSLVDALVPPVIVAGIVFGLMPVMLVDSWLQTGLTAGAVTFPLAFVASLALRGRSSKSFPITQAAVAAVRRLPHWIHSV